MSKCVFRVLTLMMDDFLLLHCCSNAALHNIPCKLQYLLETLWESSFVCWEIYICCVDLSLMLAATLFGVILYSQSSWFLGFVLLMFHLHMASHVLSYGWLANYKLLDRQVYVFQWDDTDTLLLTSKVELKLQSLQISKIDWLLLAVS